VGYRDSSTADNYLKENKRCLISKLRKLWSPINGSLVTERKVLEGMIQISGVVELFLVVRVTNLMFTQADLVLRE